MTRAASIDAPRALAVFKDGKPHAPKDVAIACQVHTRTAAWFLRKMAERGILEMLPPAQFGSVPDFGEFIIKSDGQ